MAVGAVPRPSAWWWRLPLARRSEDQRPLLPADRPAGWWRSGLFLRHSAWWARRFGPDAEPRSARNAEGARSSSGRPRAALRAWAAFVAGPAPFFAGTGGAALFGIFNRGVLSGLRGYLDQVPPRCCDHDACWAGWGTFLPVPAVGRPGPSSSSTSRSSPTRSTGPFVLGTRSWFRAGCSVLVPAGWAAHRAARGAGLGRAAAACLRCAVSPSRFDGFARRLRGVSFERRPRARRVRHHRGRTAAGQDRPLFNLIHRPPAAARRGAGSGSTGADRPPGVPPHRALAAWGVGTASFPADQHLREAEPSSRNVQGRLPVASWARLNLFHGPSATLYRDETPAPAWTRWGSADRAGEIAGFPCRTAAQKQLELGLGPGPSRTPTHPAARRAHGRQCRASEDAGKTIRLSTAHLARRARLDAAVTEHRHGGSFLLPSPQKITCAAPGPA